MGAEFLKENAKVIEKVKPNPNVTDLYLAHFLGAGGATKFLKAPPDAIGADMMPKEAKANDSIFYTNKGKGRARSISEIYTELESRLVSRASEYGFSPGAQPANNTSDTNSTTSDVNGNTPVGPTTPTPSDAGSSTNNTDTAPTSSTPPVPSDAGAGKPAGNTSAPITDVPTVNPSSPTAGIADAVNKTQTPDTTFNAKSDVAKLEIAGDSNSNLKTISGTLTRSLDTQTKMVNLLEQLVASNASLLNKTLSMNSDNGNTSETGNTPVNNTSKQPMSTDMGTPAVNLKRKTTW